MGSINLSMPMSTVLTSAVDISHADTKYFLSTLLPRIEPGAAGCVARTIPLCYAALLVHFVMAPQNKSGKAAVNQNDILAVGHVNRE